MRKKLKQVERLRIFNLVDYSIVILSYPDYDDRYEFLKGHISISFVKIDCSITQ